MRLSDSLRSLARKPALLLGGLVLLALGLRLALVGLTNGAAYDLTSYHIQAQSVFAHHNVYLLTDRYPYPPVWIWLVSLAQWGAIVTGWPLAWFVKVPGILGDCLIVALLWRWAGGRAALFYACNPVSLLITGGHGQFDGLVMALVMAAWAWWSSRRRGVLAWASLALGGAIALKGYPCVFLPALVVRAASHRQRVMVVGLALLPLALSFIVYGTLFGWEPAMISRVFGYSSYPYFGWALYVDVLVHHMWPARFHDVVAALSFAAHAAILLVVGLLSWRQTTWPLERLWLAIILGVYVLAPGLAVQYFLWALPLLAVMDRRRGLVYTTLSFVAMTLFYLTQESGVLPWGANLTEIAPQPLWLSGYVLSNLPWWGMCLWLLRVVLRRSEHVPGAADAGMAVMVGQGAQPPTSAPLPLSVSQQPPLSISGEK